MTPCLQVYKHLWHLLRGLAGKGKTQVHTSFLKKRKKGSRKKERLKKKSAMQSKIYESLCLPTRGVSYAVIDVVYFSMEKVLLYWSVYQYNNVQKSDRLSGKYRKGVLCCQMAILRFIYFSILYFSLQFACINTTCYSAQCCSYLSTVVSCDLIPIMWVMLLVHKSILLNKQKSYTIPPPFTFKVLKLMYWPQIRLLCTKRKRERVKFVAPPREMLLSFCVRFLTNYDVRKRKQYIDLTVLCVIIQNFWAVIKKHETTSTTLLLGCSAGIHQT